MRFIVCLQGKGKQVGGKVNTTTTVCGGGLG